MEFLIVWILCGLIGIVVRLVRVARNTRTVEEETLCLTCVNAVVTRGTRGQKLVACNLNGNLRPVKFAVCQCTAYCVPGGPPKLVTIEGFAPQPREAYAEVAIS